jgi:hypothetical protein
MPVAVVKKDELKLIQEEEERSMGSKLALKWAIQPRSSKLYKYKKQLNKIEG